MIRKFDITLQGLMTLVVLATQISALLWGWTLSHIGGVVVATFMLVLINGNRAPKSPQGEE